METICSLNSVNMTKRKHFLWLNIPKRQRFVVKPQCKRTVRCTPNMCHRLQKKNPTTTANTRSKRKIEEEKYRGPLQYRKCYIKYQKYIYTCNSNVIEITYSLLPGKS
jgi:hypothetical protein